jgi:hypothetical protein
LVNATLSSNSQADKRISLTFVLIDYAMKQWTSSSLEHS